MAKNTLIEKSTAYRVEVETVNAVNSTTKTVDDLQYLNCRQGVMIVITNDPAMIMRTFRVLKLEKIGPGYVLE